MIPSDSIAIDGDTAWWLATPGQGVADDLQQLRLLERSCDTCGGSGLIDPAVSGDECPDCDGTGQYFFDIEVANRVTENYGHYIDTLRVHVVYVLPLVAVDGQIEGEPCVDMITNIWFPCWTREDEPAHYLAGHAPIPSAAKPGDWIVQLAIHERNQ